MPLSKPAPRQHLHTREIVCRGYKRDDGLWDIEALLTDTKTYAFDNIDRGVINAGEPLHGMAIRLTVDETLTVREIEAASDFTPFSVCPAITGAYASLKGIRMGRGWREAVRERVGRVKGCTHLTDLLIGPLLTAAIHTVQAAREKLSDAGADGQARPPLLETCHAFAPTSPVVKRRWPAFYTGR
ncbi:MAG: DUF2889 domain-containing protein [Pseudomonadota bacterium]